MIHKCQIQEVGHHRTEQKIKLTGTHVFRCKQRKFKYFFDQIDNICLLYIV